MKMRRTKKHPKLHLNDEDNPWPLTGLYHKHNSSLVVEQAEEAEQAEEVEQEAEGYLRLEGGLFMEVVEEAERKEAVEEVVNVGDINHVR